MFSLLYSALYVVDLVKFRKIAAGDRLRGQYQALSQDPNSLSNLDQVSIFIICRDVISLFVTGNQFFHLPPPKKKKPPLLHLFVCFKKPENCYRPEVF